MTKSGINKKKLSKTLLKKSNLIGNYFLEKVHFTDLKLNFHLKIALEEYGSVEQFKSIFQCQIGLKQASLGKMVVVIHQ